MRTVIAPHLALSLALLLVLPPWHVGRATTITVNGLSFSDEGGGFHLVSASGSGSRGDPYVVVEEFTGPEAAIMVIRGLAGRLNRNKGTIAVQSAGFALRKVVVNRTGAAWQLFDMELREELELPSDYHDGLSFDQIHSAPRPFRADRFALSDEVEEPFDYIRFSHGIVPPGETVTFNVTVTDTSPRDLFYLIQRPRRPIAGGPGPGHRRLALNR
jgi:hypothetical protein